ncbi:MAG TPA: winged helix-turn-helix domain-containing protein [Nitrososphaera sp.]|nr:winged helix-turn-helix domain-containing protein [Nitrososphaera sp.]
MMGKVDTAASILELALKETSSDLLQAKTNLSPKLLGEQLRMLKVKDLLEISGSGEKVKITKRGMQFLDLYRSIHARYLRIPA